MTAIVEGQTVSNELRAIPLLNARGAARPWGVFFDGITIWVFLRHFGCLACHEHVAKWKPHLSEFADIGARVFFIGNGKPEQLHDFIQKVGLDAEPTDAFTEPTLEIHRALRLTNSLSSTVGPSAAFNALRALSKGHMQSSVQGNVLQQGGLLLMTDGRIVRLHRERILGDFLPVSDVLNEARAKT